MSGPIRIPDGFVDELKARIRPSDVIGRKVKLKKQGKEWVGLSPFTNEKTPSFYVNDQKKIFKCFSSGMGGDVISFVMETERLSFMEAVEKLADEAGMSLPKATAGVNTPPLTEPLLFAFSNRSMPDSTNICAVIKYPVSFWK